MSGETTQELLELASRLVDRAAAGEELEALAVRQIETNIEALDGEVDALKSAETRGVGVRVISDGRQGYASTADVSDDGLKAVLAEARSNASVATPDEANGLPEAQDPKEIDGLVDESVLSTPVEDKIALALRLEASTKEADERVRGVDMAAYGDTYVEHALASTTGVELVDRRTDAFAYVFTLVSEGDETQTGLGVTIGRAPGDVDVEAAGREGAERGVRLLGAHKPDSRRCAVVFDPYATASFLGVLAQALSAEAVLKGRSLFADRVGDEVASSTVTLLDDGLHPDGPATAPFDAEGVPQQRTDIVADGVLRAYLHNTWTARRFGDGARSTGNASRAGYRSSPGVAPTNLYLEPGERSPEEIVSGVGDGVYVQDVVGLHSGANPISGDFSVGITGLEIRGGSFAAPIREATVASTIVDVLRSITAVGSDLRFYPFGGALGGSTVLIDEMSVGGR